MSYLQFTVPGRPSALRLRLAELVPAVSGDCCLSRVVLRLCHTDRAVQRPRSNQSSPLLRWKLHSPNPTLSGWLSMNN